LIASCTTGATDCGVKIAALQEFNQTVSDQLAQGLYVSTDMRLADLDLATKQSVFNYDAILGTNLAGVQNGSVTPQQAIANSITQITSDVGKLNTFLDTLGIVGGAAACAGTAGVACVAGLVTAAASANHAVPDVSQAVSGLPGGNTPLINALLASGISQGQAIDIQVYVDTGVLALNVVNGVYVFSKSLAAVIALDISTQNALEAGVSSSLAPKVISAVTAEISDAAKSSVPAIADAAEYSDILSPEARQHILYGDSSTTGGHYPPGNAGKTLFPATLTPDQVIHDVGDIVTAPDTQWYAQTGTGGELTAKGGPANWAAWETRDGVQIRVVYQPATGKVLTAFPDTAGPPVGVKAIVK